MGHFVANYYNMCAVLLTNHEIGTSIKIFPLKGYRRLSKKPHHVPWLNSQSFCASFFESWLSNTSIIYEVEQS